MITINLLAVKKAVKIPPIFSYGVIATVVIGIVIIVFSFYLNNKVSKMNSEVTAKEKKLAELAEMIKEVQNYEKDNKEFRAKTEIIEQLKRNQSVPLKLLDEVSVMLPKGVWLSSLIDKGGVINIEGFADTNYDLVGYVQNLKGSKYFLDVSLVESRQITIESIEVYKFKLTFRVKV